MSPTAMPFTHAGVRLRGTFSPPTPRDATRATILSWGSSLLQGVTRSTRRLSLDMRHLSQGFRPFSVFGEWSLRLLMPASPTQPTTFRPQAFAASRRLSPPPTFRAFRRGNARGVFPTGFSPPEQAPELVTRELPSWRCSTGLAHSPPRKGENRGREDKPT